MKRTEEFWTNLQNTFNPEEILIGERSKHFYCEREHEPIENMRIVFRRSMQKIRRPKVFFTGHRGSGKSSMLLRFLELVKNDFFVVYFDIMHNLDSRTMNQIDLLYLLGATIFKVAKEEGVNPDKKHLEELAKSIYTICKTNKEAKERSLNITELVKRLACFGSSMLGGSLAGILAKAVLEPVTFTSGINEEIARKREIEPQVQEVINNVNLIIADIETITDKPLLVVVDGLDKLQRFEQAKLIFLESRALLGPVCRVIYTVPMLIFNSQDFAQLDQEGKSYILPNVKLFERGQDNKRYGRGYNTMREVVTKRLQLLNIKLNDVFAPGVLNMLIHKSGGVMRWLIDLVQDSCAAAELMKLSKVNKAAAQKAIDNRSAQLAGRLTTEMVKELCVVRKEKRPSSSQLSSDLLHGLLIVAYRNKTTWFDAHPLIWSELKGGR